MAKLSTNIVKLADELHSAAIQLLRQLRVEDRAAGIGPAQLSALSVLVFGGTMSLKRLAAIEQVKPPTMVRIVRGLIEQRLAMSRPDASDARRIEISATALGRTLMYRARTRRVRALASLLVQKTESELEQLRRAVDVLRELPSATAVNRKQRRRRQNRSIA
jgi:DNA-binding MarR family transcriptional regulator